MAIVRWDPARDLASMEIDRLNGMFANFFDGQLGRTWTPAVDIYETDDHEVVLPLRAVLHDSVDDRRRPDLRCVQGRRADGSPAPA